MRGSAQDYVKMLNFNQERDHLKEWKRKAKQKQEKIDKANRILNEKLNQEIQLVRNRESLLLNKKPVTNTYKKPVLYDLRTQNN